MGNQVGLLAHGLVVKVVRCPFEEIIEYQRHEDRSDDQGDHVQEDDPGEDGFE
jgi:hypothetical protein